MRKLKMAVTLVTVIFWVGSLVAEPKLFDPDATKKSDNQEKMNLDFNDQEIVDVAKQIAVLIDRNIIIDPAVRGKITLISPKKVTIKEAYNAFLAAISMQGITVIDSGNFLKIVKVDKIKQNSTIDLGDVVISQDESYVTQMINVKYIDASQLKKSIESMISKGNIEVYAPTNTLIITDSAKNIKRVKKVIASLDVEGFEQRVEFISLKYAPAKVVAEKLNSLLNIGKKSSGYSSGYSSGKYSSKSSSSSYAQDRKKTITSIIADERTNSIIVKATDKGIREVQNLIMKLDTDLTNDQNAVKPFFYHLEHTEAVKVSEVLNSILNSSQSSSKSRYGGSKSRYSSAASSYRSASYGGSGSSGAKIGDEEIKVTADEATNSLIIMATQSGYESILPIVAELDRQRKQVNIAATIMEVFVSKGSDIGTSLNGGFQSGEGSFFGGTNTFGQDGVSSANLENDPGKLAGLSGLLFGASVGAVELGSITLPAIGALFQANSRVKDINVLQKPNITTLDNNEATIKIGQKVYIPTTTVTDGNSSTSYTSEDVLLQLIIKPKVNNKNEVTMEINQKIEDLASKPKESNVPANILTRNAETIAMAKSGETIAIGGIISDHKRSTVSKVPILGDIPVLGYLFKHKSESSEKKNLIIFITPTVLGNSADIADLNNMTIERRAKFYEELGIEEDNWISQNSDDTHSAGITIQYENKGKAGKANTSNNAESYFQDSSDGISTYEVEGTSGQIQ